MEKNSKSLMVFFVFLLVVVFFGLTFFYLRSKSQSAQQGNGNAQNTPGKTGQNQPELPTATPVTKIEIGTQGLTRGKFSKVENNEIYLETASNTMVKLALTTDEIAVSCTTQDLAAATELDFNLVSKVNVATPQNLATYLLVDETVVVIAQDVSGVNRVHTVALDAAKCTQ